MFAVNKEQQKLLALEYIEMSTRENHLWGLQSSAFRRLFRMRIRRAGKCKIFHFPARQAESERIHNAANFMRNETKRKTSLTDNTSMMSWTIHMAAETSQFENGIINSSERR